MYSYIKQYKLSDDLDIKHIKLIYYAIDISFSKFRALWLPEKFTQYTFIKHNFYIIHWNNAFACLENRRTSSARTWHRVICVQVFLLESIHQQRQSKKKKRKERKLPFPTPPPPPPPKKKKKKKKN